MIDVNHVVAGLQIPEVGEKAGSQVGLGPGRRGCPEAFGEKVLLAQQVQTQTGRVEPLRQSSLDHGGPVSQGATEPGSTMQVNIVLAKDIDQPVDHPRRLHHEDDPFSPGPLLKVGQQTPKLTRVLPLDPEIERFRLARVLKQPAQVDGAVLPGPALEHFRGQAQPIRR